MMRALDRTNTQNLPCRCTEAINISSEQLSSSEMQQKIKTDGTVGGAGAGSSTLNLNNTESISSLRSIGSFVCRICHNAEFPERLVSPCSCKGSLTYVHTFCLEHWISTSGKTKCELCQFQYNTVQTLRYTCLQSLRLWYSHSMSRRALQEDCQMFSLLTLVAFGIIGTILVGIQHYFVEEKRIRMPPAARIWTKGWLLFFLFATFTVYFLNVFILARGQLAPWYRWWQSAREIKLILENRKTFRPLQRLQKSDSPTNSEVAITTITTSTTSTPPITAQAPPPPAQVTNLQQDTSPSVTYVPTTVAQNHVIPISDVRLDVTYVIDEDIDEGAGGEGEDQVPQRRNALVPNPSNGDILSSIEIQNIEPPRPPLLHQHEQQQGYVITPAIEHTVQPVNEQRERQQQNNCNPNSTDSCIDI